jgi:ABC-type antimicrobial peptide transport system ATPase subunit
MSEEASNTLSVIGNCDRYQNAATKRINEVIKQVFSLRRCKTIKESQKLVSEIADTCDTMRTQIILAMLRLEDKRDWCPLWRGVFC